MLNANLSIDPGRMIAPVDPRLYSSFVEHMGRAVYTGIYEPGHPSAGADGFREDVKALIRPLNLSHIRYPGGNFVSGYDWRDGVGPVDKRPVRRDLAWFALEPNRVGVDEFLAWCEGLGVSPMLAVNLGTGTPKEAVQLLEYANAPAGETALSNLRRDNGRAAPYGVKLWCLGNEMDGPWQICAMTAREYARKAHETAKLMKWMDPGIELIACGSSNHAMPTFGEWERTVLRHCWEEIDYLSLHSYYQNTDGDLSSFLSRSEDMDEFIREVEDICREIGREKGDGKRIHLAFDEWNVWYHWRKERTDPPKWTCPRAIEEEDYDFSDALLVGALLTTLINHADTVKISCMAQLVNVLAPITTVAGGGAFVRTTYWPFLHASRYGRGAALRVEGEIPTRDCAARAGAPLLSAAAVLDEAGETVSLFLVNKSQDQPMRLRLAGLSGSMISRTALQGYAPGARNTERAQPVRPEELPLCAPEDIALAPLSWNVVRIRLTGREK